ncbi:MAG TPA: hypothetical protein VKQ10_02540 [Spirochaetota bacterium]|nr:hypothetical protein [Spirochaetota bacterium]
MKTKKNTIKSDCYQADGWCLTSSENICLAKCIFDNGYRDEIKEINKHEIIVKISEILGEAPSDICRAEEIFEHMKFEIANYIIHHEYNCERGINADLLLWLDSKTNPGKMQKLNNFIEKYIK